jgi:serine/threonine-protein phosphatase 2A activator
LSDSVRGKTISAAVEEGRKAAATATEEKHDSKSEAETYTEASSGNNNDDAVSAEGKQHPTVEGILRMLDKTIALVEKHPPLDTGGSRFGNAAFRDFFDDVERSLPNWHEEQLGIKKTMGLTERAEGEGALGEEGEEESVAAVDELSAYFLHSLGSRDRLDYGSGHELNFALWLLCLNRLSLLPPSTFSAVAALCFPRYLHLARAIQMAYYLEPAGSHGVWGLDDFQFLPFLLGAAQLAGHPYMRPKSIHNAAVLEEYKEEYMYLEQVAWVNSTKNVEGLRWHSPMLDDISSAKSWEKVEGGMRKMFVKEVLEKRPVMQHFLFGGLIPAVESMSLDDDATDAEHGHDHGHDHGQSDGGGDAANSWGDCCGIRVPSSVGANLEARKQTGSEKLRRIPFD